MRTDLARFEYIISPVYINSNCLLWTFGSKHNKRIKNSIQLQKLSSLTLQSSPGQKRAILYFQTEVIQVGQLKNCICHVLCKQEDLTDSPHIQKQFCIAIACCLLLWSIPGPTASVTPTTTAGVRRKWVTLRHMEKGISRQMGSQTV